MTILASQLRRHLSRNRSRADVSTGLEQNPHGV